MPALNGPFCSLTQLQGEKNSAPHFFRSHTIFVLSLFGELLRMTLHVALLFPSLWLPVLLIHHPRSERCCVQFHGGQTQRSSTLDTLQLFMATTFNPPCKRKSFRSLLLTFIYVAETTESKDISGEITKAAESQFGLKFNFPKKGCRSNEHSLCYS